MQLHREIERIHAAGAELVVVGSGAPHFVAGFRETTDFDGPIYCDPTLAVYEAAGLKRGRLRTLGPRSALASLRAAKEGFKQGRVQGDAYQQGGVLVIVPPGEAVYRHVSEYAGDNAPVADVVRVVESLAWTRK